jgi:hypothetical protein
VYDGFHGRRSAGPEAIKDGGLMSDFQVFWGDFNTTEIVVNAVSNAGREWMASKFGCGAVGATLRKSSGQSFLDAIADAGLTACVTTSEVAA